MERPESIKFSKDKGLASIELGDFPEGFNPNAIVVDFDLEGFSEAIIEPNESNQKREKQVDKQCYVPVLRCNPGNNNG